MNNLDFVLCRKKTENKGNRENNDIFPITMSGAIKLHQIPQLPKYRLHYEVTVKMLSEIELPQDTEQICLAIPTGKKGLVWYYGHSIYSILLSDVAREPIFAYSHTTTAPLSFGTMLYGTLLTTNDDKHHTLIVESVLYYEGMATDELQNTYCHVCEIMKNWCANLVKDSLTVVLPNIWNPTNSIMQTLEQQTILYDIRHIQIRNLNVSSPYYNYILNSEYAVLIYKGIKAMVAQLNPPPLTIPMVKMEKRRNMPIYKSIAIFAVRGDKQGRTDIYNLYAYDPKAANKRRYYDDACIQTMEQSWSMRRLFRHRVKYNGVLDVLEESDDDELFETPENNLVQDELLLECKFNTKHMGWIPIKRANVNAKITPHYVL